MKTRAFRDGHISFGQLMASYWWLVILPAYMGQMINEREFLGPKDAALAMASYIAAGVPWVRDVVNAMTSGFDYNGEPCHRGRQDGSPAAAINYGPKAQRHEDHQKRG